MTAHRAQPETTGRTPGRERLIVFTRVPQPGAVKTRLIPALGPGGAARLHHEMTVRTLAHAGAFARRRDVAVEVRYTGGSAADMARLYGSDRTYLPQARGDLGARLVAAVGEAFAGGARSVVVIGADCPDLDVPVLDAAFTALTTTDLVLGPATDGGYYLLGLRRPAPALFQGIAWGTSSVLRQTVALARQIGLSINTLHQLQDVDEPEDLPVWERACRQPVAASQVVHIPAAQPELDIRETKHAPT